VVAAVNLSVLAVYMLVRVFIANRLVGATLAESARAVLPAVSVSAGMAACGVPVLLLVEPGIASLAAVIGAGAVGALAGAALGGRAVIADVVRTVMVARAR
jgi:PST family polysaccharide transporter